MENSLKLGEANHKDVNNQKYEKENIRVENMRTRV